MRIVVGVDGSPGSRPALHWAADEARDRRAELDVVIAWQYPAVASLPGGVVLPAVEEMEAAALATATDMVEREGLTGPDAPTVRVLTAGGNAAPALLAAAADADLLVVGSRGHGAFAGMLLGSVSQHCVAHAPCPVVVVPPPGT